MTATTHINKKPVFHLIDESKISGFKGLKRLEYDYENQILKVTVRKFNNTRTTEHDLKAGSTTTLKEVEDEYLKIT